MPLISAVGRKSFNGRMVIAAVYLMLIIGSITMVVPFMMTLTASVTNSYDLEKYRLIPRYLWDNEELYLKYLFEKYPPAYFRTLKSTHRLVGINSSRDLILADRPADILPEIRLYHESEHPDYTRIETDYHEFLSTFPAAQCLPCFIPRTTERWRIWLRDRYMSKARQMGLLDGTRNPEQVAVDLMNAHYGEIVADKFETVILPEGLGYAPKSYQRNEKQTQNYQEFLRQSDVSVIVPQRADDQYCWFLTQKYGTIELLNAAWGTQFQDFVQVRLPRHPPTQPVQRLDWEDFFKRGTPLGWVTVSDSYADNFRSYLQQQFSNLDRLNLRLATSFETWEQVPLTSRYEGSRAYRELWSEFVVNHIPFQDRNISYFEKEYARYLESKYVTTEAVSEAYSMPIASFDDFRIPYAELDYHQYYSHRAKWRWYLLTNNFGIVIRYIATKGRALWNTLILVGLTVIGLIVVNPIAAYALSRYHFPNAQLILSFFLIPMAFPPEVGMIPSFLLLRDFPLMIVITLMVIGMGILAWRNAIESSSTFYRFKSLGTLAIAGIAIFFVPWLYWCLNLPPKVSLLNTYVALILPGLANGFSIFLLKGFFDGLPRELYEAAQIDGAGELRMFWVITYPLAKPIIFITVMGGALGAYGSFMWAFVVVPDEKMWTLMVWLYQFSSDYGGHSMSLVMAALVVASIPTFLLFAFCQRIILRGIILPVMK